MANSNASNEKVAVVHGLELHTPFEIWPGSTLAKRECSHQVSVTVVAPPVNEPALSGELIAEYIEHGERLYAFARSGPRTNFVFPGLCNGWFDLELGRIELCTESLELAALVLPNTIVAVLLTQLGALTLHGSAIQFEGGTLAFCGPSTAGKTTCAAAMTLMGAKAVTDDLLRVEFDPAGSPLCFPGIPEFRLRTTHAWALPQKQVRALVDERTGFTPQHISHEKSRVQAIVFPVAGSQAGSPQLIGVKGQAVVRRLLQSSRIAWTPQAGLGFLRQLSILAKQVALWELHLDLARLKDASYREHLVELLRPIVEGRGGS